MSSYGTHRDVVLQAFCLCMGLYRSQFFTDLNDTTISICTWWPLMNLMWFWPHMMSKMLFLYTGAQKKNFLKICTGWPFGTLPPTPLYPPSYSLKSFSRITIACISKFLKFFHGRLTYDPAGATAIVPAPYFLWSWYSFNYIGHWCLDISYIS